MNIVVIARTRNEERNISKFCHAYSWADTIIVADGGSTDRTVSLAHRFQNVTIRRFTERVKKLNSKEWRNPHGRHINYMIHEAEKLDADWIIFDDVDCLPTHYLQSNARRWIESTDKEYLFVNRIYAYGRDKYFEKLTLPSGKWGTSTSLYGWRSLKRFYASEVDPFVHEFIIPKDARILHFSPPLAVIHDYYPDDTTRKNKVEFYRRSGEQPGCRDPLDYGGKILDMENWMIL